MDSGHERRQARQIEAIALLADPVRRSLYDLVVSREPDDMSRDEAAQTLGIRRGLAAFHLDKLVEANLMEAHFRRPRGLGGPGAGRPTKFYRRRREQIDVSLPQRRYELMGRFLADSLAGSRARGARRARLTAREYGRSLGAKTRNRAGVRPSQTRLIAALVAVLGEEGFEPVRHGRHDVVLRNCPFHALATAYRDTVCKVNLALHQGVVENLGVSSMRAELEFGPDRCCVAYRAVQP